MNLNGTLHLEHVEEAKLADLAGSLIKEPGAVDWETVTDSVIDDLGDCACRSLALLALGITKLGPETRETIFRAVINASTTQEVELSFTCHPASHVPHHQRTPGVDYSSLYDLDRIEIHGVEFGIGDLTERGCDEAIEWCRKNREAA